MYRIKENFIFILTFFCSFLLCLCSGKLIAKGLNNTFEASKDSFVLVALYNSTDGPNWINTWDMNKPMETWHGVILNDKNCVLSLDLRDNGLSGTLPESLAQMENLLILNLACNNLSGCIPEGYIAFCGRSISLACSDPNSIDQNSNLPWQGDFSRFCDGEVQIGAACDDGDPDTIDDVITVECGCMGELIVVNECRERDSLALVALYNATDGPNWTNIWDLSTPMDGWFGVTLSEEGCVVCLVNSETSCFTGTSNENNMVGELPQEIGDLINLQKLDLSGNRNLIGKLPQEIGLLANLNELWIRFTKIGGLLPSEIGNLTSLRNLRLESNDFSGSIPNSIGQLSNLEDLVLANNSFEGDIPKELWELRNLRQLSLSTNSLSGEIPAEIGNLINLTTIELNQNSLSGELPKELGNLHELLFLRLFGNNLNGELPEELGNLQNLKSLGLNDNSFSGTIPISIANLDKLTSLSLSSNILSGEIPIELDKLLDLKSLRLADNMFSGTIPEELGNLQNLLTLGLNDNDISGTIPSSLGNLTNLSRLYIQNNRLEGCIPPELMAHCPLGFSTNINSSGYNFTNNPGLPWQGDFSRFCAGEEQIGASCDDGDPDTTDDVITVECGCEGQLIVVNKCRERDSLALVALYNATDDANWTETWDLSESIDGWYGVTLNEEGCIVQLDLNSHNLTGEIPSEIGNLTNLTSLNLYSNSLTGEIPSEIGNLTNLRQLFLFSNELTGEIPKELGNLTNLFTLRLEVNSLTGEIPSELGDLPNLRFLLLFDNNLTGEIPSELGNLNLTQLWLLNNNLSGCIPQSLTSLCTEVAYDLSNNPALPWQGDFSRFCAGEEQIGATCDDGDPDTTDDVITAECGCEGQLIVVNECRERDSLALVALYNATDGANWTETWDLSEPMDGWFGVTLNEDGCVTCLDLDDGACGVSDRGNGNNLKGTIPIELGNLSSIEVLDLNDRNIFIGFPKFLLNLKTLKYLDLKTNINDSLPEAISNLDNLIVLNLRSNGLFGDIPFNISKLRSLERLDLWGNNLEGEIPKNFGNLISLKQLYVPGNNLEGEIPSSFYDLKNLQVAWLSGNSLTGEIDPAWSKLDNLTRMDIGSNMFSGQIPDELSRLSNLRALILSNNNLEGIIPASLGELINLKWLVLSNNNFRGELPPELSNLDLDRLFFEDNMFEGKFPVSYRKFCDLSFKEIFTTATPPSGNGYNFLGNPDLIFGGDFELYCTCSGNKENVVTICEGESHSIGTSTYTQSGEYEDTLLGENGCDTLVTTRLTVLANESFVSIQGGDQGVLYTCSELDIQLVADFSPTQVDIMWTADSPVSFQYDDNNPGQADVKDLSPGLNKIRFEIMTLDDCSFIESDEIEIYLEIAPQPAADIINAAYETVVSIPDPSANDAFAGVSGSYSISLDESLLPGGQWSPSTTNNWEWVPEAGCFGTFTVPYSVCNDACPALLCSTSEITIEIADPVDLGNSIPNAISPNGDGYNDQFVIPLLKSFPQDYPESILTIFNRWGQVMYHDEAYQNDWDGATDGGDALPVGTYYYTWDPGNGEDLNKGRVAVLR